MKNLIILLLCSLLVGWVACQPTDELVCPKLSVLEPTSTSEINFGQKLRYVRIEGEIFEQKFDLVNAGGGKLKIGTIQTDSLASIVQTDPNILMRGEHATFKFRLESLKVGSYLFEVRIPSNDWEQPMFVFYIELIVEPTPKAVIAVYEEQNLIPSPHGVYVLDSTVVGETYPMLFRITNEGNANLTITQISSSSAAFYTTQPLAHLLEPQTETTFVVTFSPTQNGAHQTHIRIVSSDHNNNPYQFTIEANPIAAPKPELSVFWKQGTSTIELQNGYEFVEGGTLTLGFDVFFEFTIKNEGHAPLKIDSIRTDRANAVAFNLRDNTLLGNETTTFSVRLVALQIKEEIAQVRIYTNDDDENPFVFKIRTQTQEPAFRIRYQTLSMPEGLNGDTASDGGANRTLFLKEFEVIDPNDMVTSNAVLHIRTVASTGASSSFTARSDGTPGRRIYFENNFDKLFYRQSIRFGDIAEYIDFVVYLQLPNGQTSNLESYRVHRPDGAN